MLRSRKITRNFSDGDSRPISKHILIRNIFLIYITLYFFIFFFELLSISFGFDCVISLSDLFDTVPYVTPVYIFSVLAKAICFSRQVKNNTIRNIKFTTKRFTQSISDSCCPNEKILARNIGIKLRADINPHEYKL